MKEYLVNFFLWWYRSVVVHSFEAATSRLTYALYSTNTLPMAQNWLRPLFQDESRMGKALAVIIRSLWIWVGGIVSVVMALPSFVVFLLTLVLPLLAILQIIRGIFGL